MVGERKRCSICQEVKPVDEFHRASDKKSGRKSRCKDCDNAANKKWRQAKSDHLRASYRRRYAKDKGARQQRWREENREHVAAREAARRQREFGKARAREIARNAIRRGDLRRPKVCDECGSKGQPTRDGRSPIQVHHDDYSKPLDVRWLCTACHRKQHDTPAPSEADESERRRLEATLRRQHVQAHGAECECRAFEAENIIAESAPSEPREERA